MREFTITVSDEDNDGIWVASDNKTLQYGSGPSPTDAVADWVTCVLEDHHWMAIHEDELAPGLYKILEWYRSIRREPDATSSSDEEVLNAHEEDCPQDRELRTSQR